MFLSLLASLAISQFEPTFMPKTELSHYELAGSVRQVTEWIQNANPQPADKGQPDQGQPILIFIYTFCEHGFSLEKLRFNYHGEMNQREVWRYDPHGNLTKWDAYEGDSDRLVNRQVILFDYPEEIEERKAIGKRIEDAKGDILRLYRFEFDDQDRINAVIASDPEGTFESISRYEYSEDGRVIIVHPFDPDLPPNHLIRGEIQTIIATDYYYLDEDGGLIRLEQQNVRNPQVGMLHTKMIIHYDSRGLVTHGESHNDHIFVPEEAMVDRVASYKIEYVFDENGNWIEKRIFNMSGDESFLNTIYFREIEYYSN